MAKPIRIVPPEGELERRVVSLERCEIRAGEDGSDPVFTGYAAVFNDLSLDLGGFRERIAPDAFDASLAADADVRLLFNHDSNLILGRTRAGTLSLSTDEHGLKVEAPLEIKLSYARDLQISMERGDIAEMSFGFRARKDAWDSVDEESGLPIRELLAADLFDVSPVSFPAYPSTNAEVRAIAARVTELRSIADSDPIADFPLADADHDWDADAAEERVRAKTGAESARTDAFDRCFFGVPSDDAAEFSWRMLFCDVVDDTLVAVPAAIRAAGDAIHALSDDDEIPVDADTRGRLKAEVGSWYQRIATELDDETIVAPWVAEAAAEAEARAGKMISARNMDALGEYRDHAQAAADGLTSLMETAADTDTETSTNALRTRPSFTSFLKRLAEDRDWDYDDDWSVYLLTNMIGMASSFMVNEDDGPAADAMRTIMQSLSDMLAVEITEDEPGETPEAASMDTVRRRRRLRLLELSA
jgi:HK97 family phage prohead protease